MSKCIKNGIRNGMVVMLIVSMLFMILQIKVSASVRVYYNSFESNMNGWFAPYGGQLTRTTEKYFESSRCLKYTGRTESWHSPAINIYDVIKNNGAGTYHISLRINVDKLDANSCHTRLIIRGTEANSFIEQYGNNYYYSVSTPVDLSQYNWCYLSGVVVVQNSDIQAETGTFNLMVDVLSAVDNQNMYIDYVIIDKIESYDSTFSLMQTGKTVDVGDTIQILSSKTDVTYITSNSEIATVTEGGLVTAKRKGKARIEVNYNGQTIYFFVVVRGVASTIENGIYYIENLQTSNYLQITKNSNNDYFTEGTSISVNTTTEPYAKTWYFTSLNDGTYKIISAYSGLALTLKQNNESSTSVALVQEPYRDYERQKWVIEKKINGKYIIKSKIAYYAGNGLCVAESSNLAKQKVYEDDYSYYDEWILTPLYRYTVKNYFDNGYTTYYNENRTQSISNINDYMFGVSRRYLEIFDLYVTAPNATYYESCVDRCKGSVTSSNIDMLCNCQIAVAHTDRSSLFYDMLNLTTGSNIFTNVIWSGHKIISKSAYNEPETNRSASWYEAVVMIERSENSVRSLNSKGILMHELNHQIGAKDHYHEVTIKGDDTSCRNKDICSRCGDNPRPKSCIMNNSRQDISSSSIICTGCQADIREHLNGHH